MKKSLMMDIIACPTDKQFPLELFEVKSNGDDVIDGALYCKICKRFYLVLDEIPVMLPDYLREKERELGFLITWKDKLPSRITTECNPWHL